MRHKQDVHALHANLHC